MIRILLRLLIDAVLIGAGLFVGAGTLDWWRAWVLLGVLLGVRIVFAILVHRVNPDLMKDRARLPLHAGQPASDRLMLFALAIVGFFGLTVLAGLDTQRWHLFPRPAPILSALGLALFAAGWALQGIALRTNAFATTTVRLQREREHALVDRGVYARVRHPFYAGTVLVVVGMPLWLESYAALLLAPLAIALVVARLLLEERFLATALPGYDDYRKRVRHRLIPGAW